MDNYAEVYIPIMKSHTAVTMTRILLQVTWVNLGKVRVREQTSPTGPQMQAKLNNIK